MKVYSRDFSKAYSQKLNGMQERRMKASVKAIGSYWYTAWINAGQPDLDDIYDVSHQEKKMKEINKSEHKLEKESNIKTRVHKN
jgi:hypothetical protein